MSFCLLEFFIITLVLQAKGVFHSITARKYLRAEILTDFLFERIIVLRE